MKLIFLCKRTNSPVALEHGEFCAVSGKALGGKPLIHQTSTMGCSLFAQVMKIIDSIRPDRQTVMFSATFPRAMEALARRILNKPIEVQVGGRSVVCKDVVQHVVSFILVLHFTRAD